MGNLTFLILLSIVGILFILAELLIVPGVGVAGFLGLAALGGACYYAFVQIGTTAGVILICIEIVFLAAVLIYALRAKTWQRLALKTNIESTVEDGSVEISLGQVGTTETRLAPRGTARFENVAIEVKAMKGMIDPGTEVVVVLVENKTVYVKPVNE